MKPQEVNLKLLLSGHEGEVFYSPCFGDIIFDFMDENHLMFHCCDYEYDNIPFRFNGTLVGTCEGTEMMVFPSKNQRNWDGWNTDIEPQTYEDVCDLLFKNHEVFKPQHIQDELIYHPINCVSTGQLRKLYAINRLMNVARYLNGEWRPDWDDDDQKKYTLYITSEGFINVGRTNFRDMSICFKSPEDANKAVEILGNTNIRRALSEVVD